MRIHYSPSDGERTRILKGGRVLVVHPERAPMLLNTDGTMERMTAENCPEVWPIFESIIKQILRPN